jgi:hypothetical protein
MSNTTNHGIGPVQEFSLLTGDDLHWFNEGTHCHLYRKLGAHLTEQAGRPR